MESLGSSHCLLPHPPPPRHPGKQEEVIKGKALTSFLHGPGLLVLGLAKMSRESSISELRELSGNAWHFLEHFIF